MEKYLIFTGNLSNSPFRHLIKEDKGGPASEEEKMTRTNIIANRKGTSQLPVEG